MNDEDKPVESTECDSENYNKEVDDWRENLEFSNLKLELERILEPTKDFKISRTLINNVPHDGRAYLPEEFKNKENLVMIPTDIDCDYVETFILTHKKLYGVYSQAIFKSNQVSDYYAGYLIYLEPSFYYIESNMYFLIAHFAILRGILWQYDA